MGQHKTTPSIAVSLLILLSVPSIAQESRLNGLTLHGRALAERLCAQCHAVGRAGASRHTDAPPFRELSRRHVDLESLPDRLRQGLVSGHPDMPTFRFSPADARDLTAYLRSIQVP